MLRGSFPFVSLILLIECFQFLYCLACFCCYDFYVFVVWEFGVESQSQYFGLMLSICSSSCVLYSAESDVKRVHIVLSGLRMRLFV